MGLLFVVVFAAVGLSAQEAAPAVESTGFDWKTVATFLFGVVGMKVVSYLADLLNGKGAEYVSAKLEALQEKLNENSLLGQIQADDAITRILEDAIPTIFDTLTETAKQDLADGKFDKADWSGIGAKLWDEVKDHIVGGKNDYLENSSFNDGKAIAMWVIQNWFKKKKAEGALPISQPVK
jgi:hypothetical protein